MIKKLILSQFILVEKIEIEFHKELNIITGETGSGKSALMQALSFCLGKRSSTELIRHEENEAFVEAHFELSAKSKVGDLLKEAGIPSLSKNTLIIQRRFFRDGKNKILINGKPAPLLLLQKIGALLVEILDQKAPLLLTSYDHQLELLDRFSQTTEERQEVAAKYQEYLHLKKEAENLKEEKAQSQQKLEFFTYQIQDIEEHLPKEGEEEALLEEHQRLLHADDILTQGALLLQLISESPQSILKQLVKIRNLLQLLQAKAPFTESLLTLIAEVQLLLQEANLDLHNHLSNVHSDPKKQAHVEKRLNHIQALKKKYGSNVDDILKAHQELRQKIEDMQEIEERLNGVERELKTLQIELHLLCQVLTQKRYENARLLEELLTCQLRKLNMPSSEVKIELVEKELSSNGKENVRFLLRANKGEAFAEVREGVSGGELCRLLFCIKCALLDKNSTPILIFDEIDAHVGGRSATIMGEKLSKLAKHKQILCITHFAQVARFGSAHFVVSKQEANARTLTYIQNIKEGLIEEEIGRMMGN